MWASADGVVVGLRERDWKSWTDEERERFLAGGWSNVSPGRILETTMLAVPVLGVAAVGVMHFCGHRVAKAPTVVYGTGLVRPRGGSGLTCTRLAIASPAAAAARSGASSTRTSGWRKKISPTYVGEIIADGEPPARKALQQALVQEIRVVSRDEIYPFFNLPVVRPPYGSVPPPRTELGHTV